jgi:hypothetical protein
MEDAPMAVPMACPYTAQKMAVNFVISSTPEIISTRAVFSNHAPKFSPHVSEFATSEADLVAKIELEQQRGEIGVEFALAVESRMFKKNFKKAMRNLDNFTEWDEPTKLFKNTQNDSAAACIKRVLGREKLNWTGIDLSNSMPGKRFFYAHTAAEVTVKARSRTFCALRTHTYKPLFYYVYCLAVYLQKKVRDLKSKLKKSIEIEKEKDTPDEVLAIRDELKRRMVKDTAAQRSDGSYTRPVVNKLGDQR